MGIPVLGLALLLLPGTPVLAANAPRARVAPALETPVWSRLTGVGTPDRIPVFLLGEPDSRALARLGIRPGPAAGPVRTARIPRTALAAAARVPGLSGIVPAASMEWALDRSIPVIGVPALRGLNPQDWSSGFTGRNVVVGIVDSGLDVSHLDFRWPDGTSRVRFYWDQTDPTGPPPVTSAGDTLYGTEWTAAQIDLGLFAGNDGVGHGTHVAGVAAGNGQAAPADSVRYRYAGVAPEADIIVVQVDGLLESSVLDGAAYIFDRAAAQPAVVNLSLGTQFGPHDGTSPLEVGLDALAGSGRLIVAAAGNEADNRIHAEVVPEPGAPDSVSFFLPVFNDGAGLHAMVIDAFYPAADSLALTVVTPAGKRWGPYPPGSLIDGVLTGEGTLSLVHDPAASPASNQIQIGLSDFDPGSQTETAPPPASGTWFLVVEAVNALPAGGELDLWIARTTILDFAGNPPVWLRGWEAEEELASPGNGQRVLTAGAFNTKICWPVRNGVSDSVCTSLPGALGDPGRIAYFSSHGPTRDGRQKPEVIAPGFVITSALSAQMDAVHRTLFGLERTEDPDGEHFVFAGTSSAAPHLTGALALLLQVAPTLSPESVRPRLMMTADRDSFTGFGDWSPGAGAGKLRADHLVLLDVPVTPRALEIAGDEEGLPVLEWTAAPGDPVVAFELSSRDPDSGFRFRERFTGPGPHRWTDPDTVPATRVYRLTALLRGGEQEFWAEARWTSPPRPGMILGAGVPNPFRESIELPLRLGRGPVRIGTTIVDVEGRRVRRLEPRLLPAGPETVRWDGRDDRGLPVAPGVYWIRVEDGEHTVSARVVRIR